MIDICYYFILDRIYLVIIENVELGKAVGIIWCDFFKWENWGLKRWSVL